MPVAADATNLFFNKDTKVFLGQSAGRPIAFAATAVSTNALATGVAHGLTTGDRVVITGGLGTVAALTVNTVYFAIVVTSTTLRFAATFADAIAGTAITIASGTPVAGSTLMAIDGFLTPSTAIVSGTNVLTITATHNFVVGDQVSIYGITDNAYLSINGVYKVASVSTTVSFTVALDTATNGTISNPSTIRVVKTNLWELPVLNGYSLNQGTSTTEITLAEMTNSAGVSRRGRQMFTDSMNPAEWSFETYARPFKSTNHYAVEEVLWANFIGRNYSVVTGTGSTATTAWVSGVTRDGTDLEFSFAGSNSVLLGTFDIYYVLGASKVSGRSYVTGSDGGSTAILKVSDAVINEASLNFEIDGIATISWSGMGSAVTELGTFNGTDAASLGISSTNNFIRSRLTTLTAVSTSPTSTTYAITLTGGSITINNNITYLTPEVLGVVNKPIGHITGTRTVSGTINAYLDEIANGSLDLFQNIAERGNTTITNSFALNFYVGGGSGALPTAPGIQIAMGQAHIEVPSINMDDVISVEANFHALPSTVGGTDEISVIRYIGQNL